MMKSMVNEKNIEIEHLDWVAIPPELKQGLAQQPLSQRKLQNWTLVLQSRRIPCQARKNDRSWQLFVPAEHYQTACRELQHYETENRDWPPPPPKERKLHENTSSTIWILILLAVFHNLTIHKGDLFGQYHIDWFELGNAHAQKILSGEWWRLVTALTLHSGALHLAGNIAVGGMFMVRLCRILGSGRAWFLVLVAGILGNLVNACVQSPVHRSIGASTAAFGAVGLLAAINMLHFRENLWRRWPVPIAAALGLLALLGTGGENTDIAAHLFGFLFGIGLGFLSAYLADKNEPLTKSMSRTHFTNKILAITSIVIILTAWTLALTITA